MDNMSFQPSEYDPPSLEGDVEELWDDLNLPELIKRKRAESRKIYLAQIPHLLKREHDPKIAFSEIIMDVWYKYHTLLGADVRSKTGFDVFMPWIEEEIFDLQEIDPTRVLKTDDKLKLMKSCKKSAEDKIDSYRTLFKSISKSSPDSYTTDEISYIDSIWWSIFQIDEKGFLEEEERLLQWCSRCRTALTDIEKKIKPTDESVLFVKVPVGKRRGRYLLMETSKPWQIVGNECLVVDSKEEFSVVAIKGEHGGEKVLMTSSNVEEIMDHVGLEDYNILKTISAERLEGMTYFHPLEDRLPYIKEKDKDFKVVLSEDLPETLTGIYPIAPGLETYDEELSELSRTEIDVSVTEDGVFEDDHDKLGEFAGADTHEASSQVVSSLKSEKLLFGKYSVLKDKEICSYCGKDVVHKRSREWFFKASDLKDDIKETLDDIEVIPEWMIDHELWTDSPVDIPLTDRKIWGIPFPMWICECGNSVLFSSVDEMLSYSENAPEVSLAPTFMEGVEIRCEECGEYMYWEEKNINRLFVASISPWAQLGYPYNEEEWIKWGSSDIFLSDIDEKVGVSYTNLYLSHLLFNRPTSKLLLGMADINFRDIKIDDIPRNFGIDSLRLELLSDRPIWDKITITSDLFESPPTLLRVLWNVYSFTKDHMVYSNFNPDEVTIELLGDYLSIEDKWLLSQLENLKILLKNDYAKVEFHHVIEEIRKFVMEDIAQFYVRLARRRLGSDDQKDILATLKVLHVCLVSVSKLLFPITPHLCEMIYQNMEPKSESIHVSEWPKINRMLIDREIEDEMKDVRELIEMIFQGKRNYDMPEKWPLKRIILDAKDLRGLELVQDYSEVVKTTARIEDIELVPPEEEWDEMILKVHPNRKAIGKAYRQWVSRISLMLKKREAKEIKKGIDKGDYKLGIEGNLVEIQPEMVTFEREVPPGYVEIEHEFGNIYLDMAVDPKLWYLQTVKDIMFRLKAMRSELDLYKADEVEIFVSAAEDILKAVERHEDFILEELSGREIHIGPEFMEEADLVLEWDVNGEPVQLGILPLYRSRLIDIYESIPGMSRKLAENLYEKGYTNLDKLKNASVSELSSFSFIKRSLARRIVQVVKEKGGELGEIEKKDEEKSLQKDKLIEAIQSVEGIDHGMAKNICERGYDDPEKIISTDTEQLSRDNDIKVEQAESLIRNIKKIFDLDLKEIQPPKKIPKETIQEEGVEEKVKIEDEDMPEGIIRGNTYLIIEKKDVFSMKLFKEIVNKGMKGLLVTRQYPEKVRKNHGLKETKMIWLSNVDRENTVRPKNLEKFSLTIEQFLAVEKGIVLINGMDYLITNNDFRTVLHLIQSLKDQVAINESILFLPVSPNTIEKYQLELLESEVDNVLKP